MNLEKITNKEILVLGVGNYLMGDEGIGCHAVEYLEKHGYSNKVDLLDGGTGGFHLMEHMITHKAVILIDATLDDLPEGTVRVFKPKASIDFPPTLSTHEIGLKDLITSLTLVEKLPDLYLIAISVKDYADLKITMNPIIENTLPEVEKQVDRILVHLEEAVRV